MSKSKVTCWKIENWYGQEKPDYLYIAYPEDNSGHDLISCLRCGHIYSVSIVKKVYFGPGLEDKLLGMACLECGAMLSETAAPYPEKYLANGEVKEFQRPIKIPDDRESTVVDFDEIYS